MRTMPWATTALAVLGAVGATGAGCFFSPEPYPGNFGGYGGSGGVGGSGGAGGTGGGGGGGVCTPGATEACYSGPAGTEGQGICQAGTRTCSDAGQWGACEGEVLPAAEVCATSVDDDCDGQVNEEGEDCDCVPGSVTACYTGPAGTRGVGLCADGQQVCNDSGIGYGPCTGDTLPAAELCGTDVDEDCDGEVWFPDTDCVCEPGSTASCYTGPAGTEVVGPCQPGTWTCNADGLTYGACMGEVTPSAEICGNAIDEQCDGVPCAEVLWTLAATGTGTQTVHDVAVDSAGNIIVVGDFTNSMTIGASTFVADGTDGFVFKLSPHGAVLWARQFGPAQEQTVRSVAVDGTDNIYLAGSFDTSITIDAMNTIPAGMNNDVDFFVAKLDPQGNRLWAQGYGSDGSSISHEQRALGIDVNSAGGVAVTGWFNGSITLGNTASSSGGRDIFVARLSGGGVPQSIVGFGTSDEQTGRSVALGNGLYVAGDGSGTFTAAGAQLDNGSTPDVIAMRLDPPSPALPWADHFGGGLNSARGLDITLDPSGNVLLAGYYNGPIDFGGGALPEPGPSRFLAKLNPAGGHLWSHGFAAGLSVVFSAEVTLGVAADSAGNVLLTGDFTGITTFGGASLIANGTDLFIVKLDPAGAHLWSRRFGDSQPQFGVAVATDPNDDHIVVAGHFLGQIDFGGTTVAANGSFNELQTLFVARLTP